VLPKFATGLATLRPDEGMPELLIVEKRQDESQRLLNSTRAENPRNYGVNKIQEELIILPRTNW
jgi:hypothetical protein